MKKSALASLPALCLAACLCACAADTPSSVPAPLAAPEQERGPAALLLAVSGTDSRACTFEQGYTLGQLDEFHTSKHG